ncbi:hypothetical protein CUMW_077560 [Citrus unshiu]|nr:hypothetical protein CUMW_077560 [Citrus unshiu]
MKDCGRRIIFSAVSKVIKAIRMTLHIVAFAGKDILDEALAFTASHLESMLSDEILHALNRPIRRGLPRLEAMYHIELYSRDDSKHKALLKFAKLDLSIITEWWKNLDVETNLPYARNSVLRRLYSILEEFEVFANAIKRWDISNRDGFLDDFGEAEEQISKEGRTDCISYVIEVGKKLVQKWCNEGVYASFTCDNLLAYAGNGVFFLAWERLLTRKPLIGSPISLKLLKHPKILKPTEVAVPFFKRILNLAQVTDVTYKDDNGYTNSYVIKDYITHCLRSLFSFE